MGPGVLYGPLLDLLEVRRSRGNPWKGQNSWASLWRIDIWATSVYQPVWKHCYILTTSGTSLCHPWSSRGQDPDSPPLLRVPLTPLPQGFSWQASSCEDSPGPPPRMKSLHPWFSLGSPSDIKALGPPPASSGPGSSSGMGGALFFNPPSILDFPPRGPHSVVSSHSAGLGSTQSQTFLLQVPAVIRDGCLEDGQEELLSAACPGLGRPGCQGDQGLGY